MLKTIGRILIIILAIGLAAGGLYWIGQNHPSWLGLRESQLGLMEEGTRPRHGAGEIFDREEMLGNETSLGFQRPEMHHLEGEGRLDSARAWSGIVRNILIIAAITLLVVGIQKFFAWLFRRRKVTTV